MRKTKLFLLSLLAASLAFGTQSCSKDKDDTPGSSAEDTTGNGGSNNNDHDNGGTTDTDNTTPAPKELSFSVNGVEFKMIKVTGYEGGDFYIGETEVTQALWEEVMGNNPSLKGIGANYPVNNMYWADIRLDFDNDISFLTKLNEATGKNFRLPSGAEWVYAAKGGDPDAVYSGCRTKDSLQFFAWYSDLSDEDWVEGCHEVASKNANGYGLYDMNGNVWEYCEDAVGDYNHLFGGGCWFNSYGYCQNSVISDGIGVVDYGVGFRLALSL